MKIDHESVNVKAVTLTRQGSTPATPDSGKDKVYLDASGTLKAVNDAGVTRDLGGGGASGGSGAVFTQYEQVAVSNTTTPTTLIGNGLGSATLLANALEQGSVVRIKYFVEQENATSSPTCEFSVTIGGEEISYTAITAPSSPSAGGYIAGEITLVCITDGASGDANAVAIASDGSAGVYAPTAAASGIPLDTTGTLAIDFTATWDTADAGNIVTLRTLTIEVLSP